MLKRTVNALIRLGQEQGKEIILAILHSITEKVGFEWLVPVSQDFLRYYKKEESAIMQGDKYVSEHKNEAIFSYINLLSHLAREFNDRKLVLIFDQFEYAGKASLEFLTNMIKRYLVIYHSIQ